MALLHTCVFPESTVSAIAESAKAKLTPNEVQEDTHNVDLDTKCPFCLAAHRSPREVIVSLNHYDSAVRSQMLAPRRHLLHLQDLNVDEALAIHERIVTLQKDWGNVDAPASINVVWNLGSSAGQTLEHLHCHVLERGRRGDPLPGYGPRWWLKRRLRGPVILRMLAGVNPSLGRSLEP